MITNEMKAKFRGEFSFDVEMVCSACNYDEPQEDCEVCAGEVTYTESMVVPWTTCKEIYTAMAQESSKETF